MIKYELDDLKPSERTLIHAAQRVREFAYAPYSKFRVGAALADESGKIHTGCNVESADYTGTSHAETVAIDSMVKNGGKRIKEIAIAMCSNEEIPLPCGGCLQKINEFIGEVNISIYLCNLDESGNIRHYFIAKFNELLPFTFKSKHFIEGNTGI